MSSTLTPTIENMKYVPTDMNQLLGKSEVGLSARQAAARALVRAGVRNDGQHNVLVSDGLHVAYHDLYHDTTNKQPGEDGSHASVVRKTAEDMYDAATMLDRVDGGFTLVIHVPGFIPGKGRTEDVKISAYYPPRELDHHRDVLEQPLIEILKIFAQQVVPRHLEHAAQHRARSGLPVDMPELSHARALARIPPAGGRLPLPIQPGSAVVCFNLPDIVDALKDSNPGGSNSEQVFAYSPPDISADGERTSRTMGRMAPRLANQSVTPPRPHSTRLKAHIPAVKNERIRALYADDSDSESTAPCSPTSTDKKKHGNDPLASGVDPGSQLPSQPLRLKTSGELAFEKMGTQAKSNVGIRRRPKPRRSASSPPAASNAIPPASWVPPPPASRVPPPPASRVPPPPVHLNIKAPLISIGPCTEAVMDELKLADKWVASLREVTTTTRSSNWSIKLKTLGLDELAARQMAAALLSDLDTPIFELRKPAGSVGESPRCCIRLTVFVIVALVFLFLAFELI
ncbi:hypothetical protein FA95DRAFT_1610218 [Auriscalpium vulgare]|uniref:Uncharacterized protein n=1 Tax=Auriscalpium vulgare TaxID=40419 RepID=A0ACB8REA0_9AGAM|nr:hypothetical protein FA95DRAFT_1610218 [Auriscalpium vulgare]